ncbi:MAG TPA: 4Fe-4S dicluster domain-containing protein [Thermoplasmata archaeon]|nr:4Fe-4S dicluster domain-containing protein [Thermoplasmata archaeon]
MKVDTEFLSRLHLGGDFDARMCINCGVCTALCPLGLELLPRRLFRSALLGDREAVLGSSELIFTCLLCRLCEANCPGGVHIAENMRALRTVVNREVHGLAEA